MQWFPSFRPARMDHHAVNIARPGAVVPNLPDYQTLSGLKAYSNTIAESKI